LYDYGNNRDQAPNMYQGYGGYQAPRRRRRTGRNLLISLVCLVVLLVALDFGARAFAENEAAIQIQKHGFPNKPSVQIAGFPFLTQVITRHFDQITIQSGNIPAGQVTISKLSVVADNVHLNSHFNGGTAGPLHGTIVIGLGVIGNALSAAATITSALGGGASALKIASVGGNKVKGSLTAGDGLLSWAATWQVRRAGNALRLHLVGTSGGVPSGLVSRASDVSIPLPELPVGLQLTGGLDATAGGITAHVYAQSLSFGS
jgi:hypothetical protein